MIFDKHHMYRNHTGIKGIPEERHTPKRIAELSDYKYLGLIGDYELLGYQTGGSDTLVVALQKSLCTTIPNNAPTPEIDITGIGGYHSSELNTNCIANFTKKDLQKLVKYMDAKDSLVVMATDYSEKHREYLANITKSNETNRHKEA